MCPVTDHLSLCDLRPENKTTRRGGRRNIKRMFQKKQKKTNLIFLGVKVIIRWSAVGAVCYVSETQLKNGTKRKRCALFLLMCGVCVWKRRFSLPVGANVKNLLHTPSQPPGEEGLLAFLSMAARGENKRVTNCAPLFFKTFFFSFFFFFDHILL